MDAGDVEFLFAAHHVVNIHEAVRFMLGDFREFQRCETSLLRILEAYLDTAEMNMVAPADIELPVRGFAEDIDQAEQLFRVNGGFNLQVTDAVAGKSFEQAVDRGIFGERTVGHE